MIRVSCVIATYGDLVWADSALQTAQPSTDDQGFYDVSIVHLPLGTLAEARNEGAALAQGDALVFLDADDELAPGYLEGMRAGLEPHTILSSDEDDVQTSECSPPHLLVPSVQYVTDGVAQAPRIPQKGCWPKLNECVIGTAVSHVLFDRVGGFHEWPSLEDYDLWLRCFDAGALLWYAPEAVYRAHITAGSRNLDQSPYNAIWQAHLDRIGEA